MNGASIMMSDGKGNISRVNLSQEEMAQLNLPGRNIFGPMTKKEKKQCRRCCKRIIKLTQNLLNEVFDHTLSMEIRQLLVEIYTFRRSMKKKGEYSGGPSPACQILHDFQDRLDVFFVAQQSKM